MLSIGQVDDAGYICKPEPILWLILNPKLVIKPEPKPVFIPTRYLHSYLSSSSHISSSIFSFETSDSEWRARSRTAEASPSSTMSPGSQRLLISTTWSAISSNARWPASSGPTTTRYASKRQRPRRLSSLRRGATTAAAERFEWGTRRSVSHQRPHAGLGSGWTPRSPSQRTDTGGSARPARLRPDFAGSSANTASPGNSAQPSVSDRPHARQGAAEPPSGQVYPAPLRQTP